MLITRLITFFEDVLKFPYLQCFFAYRILRFRSAALMKSGRNVEFTAFLFFVFRRESCQL